MAQAGAENPIQRRASIGLDGRRGHGPGRGRAPARTPRAGGSRSGGGDHAWDFEDGTLMGWEVLDPQAPGGTAFRSQPTFGEAFDVLHAGPPEALRLLDSIGGDSWDGPYPIGIHGRYWIGTSQDRPGPEAPWGRPPDDRLTGSLASPEFMLGRRCVHFLVGGTADPAQARIELALVTGAGS